MVGSRGIGDRDLVSLTRRGHTSWDEAQIYGSVSVERASLTRGAGSPMPTGSTRLAETAAISPSPRDECPPAGSGVARTRLADGPDGGRGQDFRQPARVDVLGLPATENE
jgi:hypothetical protein